jgi:hypothetical protein
LRYLLRQPAIGGGKSDRIVSEWQESPDIGSPQQLVYDYKDQMEGVEEFYVLRALRGNK